MAETRRPRPVDLERFQELLDTYGAAPARWPDTMREAAERLLAESAVARALREEAAELDRLLQTLPPEVPSGALTARVLAAAPRRSPARRWRNALAAAVPLAAAAAVAVWLTTGGEPARQQTASAPSLSIGEYTSPTDVLLTTYGVDVYGTVPSVGCADSELGCPNVPSTGGPSSRRSSSRRLLA